MFNERVWWLIFSIANTVTALQSRELVASRGHGSLRRRGLGLKPTLQDNHIYYTEDSTYRTSQLTAKVRLEPHYPTVVLDEVDEHFEYVTCHDGSLLMHFSDSDQLELARRSWEELESFVLVTSQRGCSVDGDHQAYVVSNHTFQGGRLVATMTARKQPLRSCNKRFHVSIESVAAVPRAAARDLAARNAPVSIPVPVPATPTATPTGPTVTGDLSWAYTGAVWPQQGVVGNVLQALTSFPDNLTLTCVDCYTAGTIELAAANFEMDVPDESLADQAEQIFEQGQLTFSATGVAAKFALEVGFLPGFIPVTFAARVPSIPLAPMSLGRLIKLGPVLDLVFPISVQLNTAVNIYTGFTATVPDNSQVVVEIRNFSAASVTGFQDTTIEPEPFNMDGSVSLSILTSFQPQINLVASADLVDLPGDFLDASVEGSVGVFFDTPTLNTTVSQLTHVSETCDPLAAGSKDTSYDAINVVPLLVVDGGVQGKLSLDAPAIPAISVAGTDVLVSGVVGRLPTACLKYDPTAHLLIDVTASPGDVGSGGERGPGRLGVGGLLDHLGGASASVPSVVLVSVFAGVGCAMILL